jgi:hypothetical protein
MLKKQEKQVDAARTKQLILVELVIFITLAGMAALLFQPLLGLINKRVTTVESALVRNLEKAVFKNRSIRYSSMSPSLIGSIEFHGISIGDEPEPLAAVERLYFTYSLWDLVRGKGTGAIRKLVIDEPEIIYYAERDGDIADWFSQKEGGKEASFVLPLECHISLQNG